jgi:hypothetical protein
LPKSKTLTQNTGQDVDLQEISFIAGGNAKWYILFRIILFLTKLNKLFSYNPAFILFVFI